MIAANVAAAKFLKRSRIPALYRVHPRPPTHKYEELAEFMGTIGMPLPAYEDLKPEDLMAILARAKTRPDGALIEAVVLRSQSLATYTADCDGHFGLAGDPLRAGQTHAVRLPIHANADGRSGP